MRAVALVRQPNGLRWVVWCVIVGPKKRNVR